MEQKHRIDGGREGPLEVIWSNLNLRSSFSFIGLLKVVSGWSWNIPKDRDFSASLGSRILLVSVSTPSSWKYFSYCLVGISLVATCNSLRLSYLLGCQTLTQSIPTSSHSAKLGWLMLWVTGGTMGWAVEVSSGNDAVLLFCYMEKHRVFRCHVLPVCCSGMQKEGLVLRKSFAWGGVKVGILLPLQTRI